jgi:hypothetical protein
MTKTTNQYLSKAIPIFLLILLCPFGCKKKEASLTTDTRSSHFHSTEEKISFLRTYLVFPSPASAAEFHIVYHDNSGGLVPGPSDWDIRAVLKISPENLASWIEGLDRTSEEADLAWGFDLLPKGDSNWIVKSAPEIYYRQNSSTVVALFRKEGIVFKKVTTQPGQN